MRVLMRRPLLRAEGIPGKLKRVLGARVPPWHLKNVYVLPQLRGRGCGEQLIEGMADQLVSASAAVSDEAAAGCEDGVFVYLRYVPCNLWAHAWPSE